MTEPEPVAEPVDEVTEIETTEGRTLAAISFIDKFPELSFVTPSAPAAPAAPCGPVMLQLTSERPAGHLAVFEKYITLVLVSTHAATVGEAEVTAYAPPPATATPAINATTILLPVFAPLNLAVVDLKIAPVNFIFLPNCKSLRKSGALSESFLWAP
jgi:hypothetical protein